MAQLHSLGQPFGAPSRIIQSPALPPDPLAQGLGGFLGTFLAQKMQKKRDDQQFQQSLGAMLGGGQLNEGPTAPGQSFGQQNPSAALFNQLSQVTDPRMRQMVLQGLVGQRLQDPIQQQQAQANLAKTRAETEQIGQPTPITKEERDLKKAQTQQIVEETKDIALLTPPERRDAALVKAGLKESFVSQANLAKTKSETFRNQAAATASMAAANPDKKLTATQKVSTASGFRKEFSSLSSDFRQMKDSLQKIKASAADPSAAGDIAIIFNYMKMLDPQSTVREGEFATAESAGSIPTAIWNMYNKAKTGERIAFNRSDFVRQSENMLKAQEKTQAKLTSEYTSLSRRHGIDPLDVVGGDATVDVIPSRAGVLGGSPSGVAAPTTQAEYNAIPKGTIFTDTDGTRKRKL